MFASEVKELKKYKLQPKEQLTLEPYERDHAVVVGVYRYVLCLRWRHTYSGTTSGLRTRSLSCFVA